LAPDGSKVAFISDQLRGTFVLADRAGRARSFSPTDLPPTQSNPSLDQDFDKTVDAISWDKSNAIRVIRRISPSSSRFDFFDVPDDLLAGSLRAANRAQAGELCTSAYQRFSVACTEGTDVTVDGD